MSDTSLMDSAIRVMDRAVCVLLEAENGSVDDFVDGSQTVRPGVFTMDDSEDGRYSILTMDDDDSLDGFIDGLMYGPIDGCCCCKKPKGDYTTIRFGWEYFEFLKRKLHCRVCKNEDQMTAEELRTVFGSDGCDDKSYRYRSVIGAFGRPTYCHYIHCAEDVVRMKLQWRRSQKGVRMKFGYVFVFQCAEFKQTFAQPQYSGKLESHQGIGHWKAVQERHVHDMSQMLQQIILDHELDCVCLPKTRKQIYKRHRPVEKLREGSGAPPAKIPRQGGFLLGLTKQYTAPSTSQITDSFQKSVFAGFLILFLVSFVYLGEVELTKMGVDDRENRVI